MDRDELERRAIALYDDYTHNTLDRRAFMSKLARIAGGAAAANTLLATIAPNALAAPLVAEGDTRLMITEIDYGPGSRWSAYNASRLNAKRLDRVVLIIHENRGLNAHIKDVARRAALVGYNVYALDFLAPMGGTPSDEDVAREMISKLDPAEAIAQAMGAIEGIAGMPDRARIGVTGFCWGGGMTNRIAVAAGTKVKAAAPFYGPCPPAADAAKVKAAMLLHFAEKDDRVNQTAQPWVDALKAAKVRTEAHFYPGTEHAFHNDTSAARYNKVAAELAWSRTLAHFRKHLR